MAKKKKPEKTYRFRPGKHPDEWICLVFIAGKKGVQYSYRLRILKNGATGKLDFYCTCKAQWYRGGDFMCVHKKELYAYMQKQIDEGKVGKDLGKDYTVGEVEK